MNVNYGLKCPFCGSTDFEEVRGGYICGGCCSWVGSSDSSEDDEQDSEVYSRLLQGYEYLHNYDFERARNTFQRITQDDPDGIHAYWGLLLAKFGVVYVKGFFNGISEPIYCFPDYNNLGKTMLKKTKEFAKILQLIGDDTELRDLYFDQANKIDQAIINFRKNVENTENDVFICVKISKATESDPQAKGHTMDSAQAKKLEADLQARGLKVFYSLHTLTNQVDSDDQIWRYLVKSKKMILIGSQEDYLESTWVKSEWMRWLHLNRQEQLYIYVLKHDDEAPNSILPYELRTRQVYTLDSYDKLLRHVSDMSDADDAEDDLNGKIVFTNGTEEIIPYGTEEIYESAYSGRKDIVRVILPDGIKRICNEAFANCDKMVEAKLPDTLLYIGEEVFRGCESLKEIYIPYRTQSIGVQAFENCRSLERITIPANTTEIGSGAFSRCENLVGITVDKRNKKFFGNGDCVVTKNGVLIVGCSSTQIPDDDSVMQIGQNAFCGCTNLESIDIPESVQIIDDGAFLNCRNLESITLPSSLNKVGTDAFRGCTALKKVDYDCDDWVWKGISFGKGNTSLQSAYRKSRPEQAEVNEQAEVLIYPIEEPVEEPQVPVQQQSYSWRDTVIRDTVIMEEPKMIITKTPEIEALEAELAKVRIRLEGIQALGQELADSQEAIKQKQAAFAVSAEENGYRQTELLNRAEQAAREKELAERNEKSALDNKMKAIREMELKAQVEAEARAAEAAARARAEAAAREKAKAATRVQDAEARVNAAKEEINQRAREEFEAREQALAAEQEKALALAEISKLDDEIEDTQAMLDSNAALEKRIQSKIEALLEKIRKELAKEGTKSTGPHTPIVEPQKPTGPRTPIVELQKPTGPRTPIVEPQKPTAPYPPVIEPPKPKKNPDDGYILYVDGEERILKNNDIDEIPDNAYINNDRIAIVVLPKSVERIGEHAFEGCINLTYVKMWNAVGEIGKFAFDKCVKLTDIQLSENINEIARCTFQKCESLRAINIPYGVTKIDGSAFNMCKNLEHVTLPETLEFIGARAFYGCRVGKSILPDQDIVMGEKAFG